MILKIEKTKSSKIGRKEDKYLLRLLIRYILLSFILVGVVLLNRRSSNTNTIIESKPTINKTKSDKEINILEARNNKENKIDLTPYLALAGIGTIVLLVSIRKSRISYLLERYLNDFLMEFQSNPSLNLEDISFLEREVEKIFQTVGKILEKEEWSYNAVRRNFKAIHSVFKSFVRDYNNPNNTDDSSIPWARNGFDNYQWRVLEVLRRNNINDDIRNCYENVRSFMKGKDGDIYSEPEAYRNNDLSIRSRNESISNSNSNNISNKNANKTNTSNLKNLKIINQMKSKIFRNRTTLQDWDDDYSIMHILERRKDPNLKKEKERMIDKTSESSQNRINKIEEIKQSRSISSQDDNANIIESSYNKESNSNNHSDEANNSIEEGSTFSNINNPANSNSYLILDRVTPTGIPIQELSGHNLCSLKKKENDSSSPKSLLPKKDIIHEEKKEPSPTLSTNKIVYENQTINKEEGDKNQINLNKQDDQLNHNNSSFAKDRVASSQQNITLNEKSSNDITEQNKVQTEEIIENKIQQHFLSKSLLDDNTAKIDKNNNQEDDSIVMDQNLIQQSINLDNSSGWFSFKKKKTNESEDDAFCQIQ